MFFMLPKISDAEFARMRSNLDVMLREQATYFSTLDPETLKKKKAMIAEQRARFWRPEEIYNDCPFQMQQRVDRQRALLRQLLEPRRKSASSRAHDLKRLAWKISRELDKRGVPRI